MLEVGADQARPGSGTAPDSGRRRRRILEIAGWTAIWTGALLAGFLAYELWGTGLYTSAAQEQLGAQLAFRMAEAETPPVTAAPADPSPAVSTPPLPDPPVIIEEAPPPAGEPIGRIVIPSARVDAVLVEGVGKEDLKKGPGHMPWTPLPGQPGNAVLSGHRTTYGAPFYYLDELVVGDKIYVETLIGRHTYQVREILVVEPTDVWVTDPRPGAWLTLTTCTPRYSAAQRLVIFAELIDGPNRDAIAAAYDGAVTSPR